MNKLAIQVTLNAIDKLTAPFRNASKEAQKLAQSLNQTKTAKKGLEDQQKLINSFTALKQSVSQNKQALTEAQKKAQDLAKQFNATSNPTKKLKREFENAKRAITQLKQAQIAENNKLNQARRALSEAGISTKNLSQSQRELKRKIEAANQSIQKQEQRLQKLNQRTKEQARYQKQVQKLKSGSDFAAGFGMRAMAHGGAVLGSGSLMMKPALEFEQEFSNVQALARLDKTKDAEKIKQLRDQAIQLGATTSFTSRDVAAGQGYLAMAGFNDKQILDSMPAVLNMTKAAGMEMGRVADISSDISSGFKIPAAEMNRVADVLTLTFTSSNTNLELLGETMKYLGPIAASTGQDFETMSAMVGLLGNVGIKGSQAGTSLRSAMLRLAGPPKQAAKAMKKLGLSAKDSKGNMRALTDILVDVEKKTAKMGSADKMAYYKAIFGAEAATAMVELVKQAGINGIQEMSDKLQSAAGTAEKVAETMADNVMGDLKNLQSASEALTISIFDETSDSLRELIQQSTQFLRTANQWIKANPQLAASITKWVAGISAGLVAVGALSLVFSYLLYPVGRAILFFNKFTGASKLLNLVLFNSDNKFKLLNKSLFSSKTTFNGASYAGRQFLSLIKLIPAKFLAILSKMKSLSFWLNGLKMLARVALSPLRLALVGIGSILSFLLSPIGLLTAAFVAAGVYIYRNWEKVRAFFGGFWEGLKSGLAPVIEKFKPLGDLFGVVVGWIEKAVKWFTDLLSPVQSTQTELDSARSAGEKFGNGMAKAIKLILTPLTLLMDGIKWLTENMPSWDGIKNSVSNAWDSTKNAAGSAWQSTKETASNIWGKVKEATGFGSDGNQPPVQKWSGGYVGNGGKYQPMGIVHGGEYVMTKEATSRLGIHTLNALNYGKQALIAGGLGVSVATAAPVQVDHRPPISARPVATQVAQPMTVQITINAAQGMDERMIAQQVAKEFQRIQNQQQARTRNSLRDRV
ncbi:phage tail tape measure protein [Rodentibacter pneumotropicus]|uniref:phage tail tape measure protein n=1 Tax=Rodentibacter pneumotropicus TaxID=758 RepID=UPI0009879EAC|nr:phage tail tape measure protein [Rodentibacter pneumotropicus]OOF64762.1 phage tail tape measure protein [Rodentibacter pneumotropicus]